MEYYIFAIILFYQDDLIITLLDYPCELYQNQEILFKVCLNTMVN